MRKLHNFLHSLTRPTENCWKLSLQFTGTSTTIPCPCEVSTVFCTVFALCVLISAYNWNVRHSVIELYLGHLQKHEQEGLLELRVHDHRGITHLHGHDLLLNRGATAASVSIPPWPGGGTSTDQCMPAIDVSTLWVSMCTKRPSRDLTQPERMPGGISQWDVRSCRFQQYVRSSSVLICTQRSSRAGNLMRAQRG